MTNEVELLILEKITEHENITFKKKISALIYKEIWNFILESLDINFLNIFISIDIEKSCDEYSILKAEKIKYNLCLLNDTIKYYGYYKNCNKHNIQLFTKALFDLETLCNLLENDGFKIVVEEDGKKIKLSILIYREKIDKVINDTLLKNNKVKKLKIEV